MRDAVVGRRVWSLLGRVALRWVEVVAAPVRLVLGGEAW